MTQEALFPLDPSDQPRAVGPVDVDATFSSATRIHLDETSWIDHVNGWLTGHTTLMRLLKDAGDWEQRSRWMFTRLVAEPRLTAEYPDLGRAPDPIPRLAAVLAAQYGVDYSRLWMNWYRDNNDSTGWHSDRPMNKLERVSIPVLSLGATRRFAIRPASGGPSVMLNVRGGDLIVMGGRCQRDYQHMVPKERTRASDRLSLNFSPAM